MVLGLLLLLLLLQGCDMAIVYRLGVAANQLPLVSQTSLESFLQIPVSKESQPARSRDWGGEGAEPTGREPGTNALPEGTATEKSELAKWVWQHQSPDLDCRTWEKVLED